MCGYTILDIIAWFLVRSYSLGYNFELKTLNKKAVENKKAMVTGIHPAPRPYVCYLSNFIDQCDLFKVFINGILDKIQIFEIFPIFPNI